MISYTGVNASRATFLSFIRTCLSLEKQKVGVVPPHQQVITAMETPPARARHDYAYLLFGEREEKSDFSVVGHSEEKRLGLVSWGETGGDGGGDDVCPALIQI